MSSMRATDRGSTPQAAAQPQGKVSIKELKAERQRAQDELKLSRSAMSEPERKLLDESEALKSQARGKRIKGILGMGFGGALAFFGVVLAMAAPPLIGIAGAGVAIAALSHNAYSKGRSLGEQAERLAQQGEQQKTQAP